MEASYLLINDRGKLADAETVLVAERPPLRYALNLQDLEISQEFPDFPDFELRSPEQSQKFGVSWFRHGKSSEWTGIISIYVKISCFAQFCLSRSRSVE